MLIDNSVIIDQPSLSVPYATLYDATASTHVGFQAVATIPAGNSGTFNLQGSVDGDNFVDVPGQSVLFANPPLQPPFTDNAILSVDILSIKILKLTYTPIVGDIGLKVTVSNRNSRIVET